MKTRWPTLLSFSLSLLLALTAQGVSQSRGINAAVGQVEICSGHGPVVVYIDADGQPTQAPHYCPDFAVYLLGAIASPDISAPEPPVGPGLARMDAGPELEGSTPRSANARAPPGFV